MMGERVVRASGSTIVSSTIYIIIAICTIIDIVTITIPCPTHPLRERCMPSGTQQVFAVYHRRHREMQL